MTLRGLLGLSLIASGLLATGCASERPAWVALEPDMPGLLDHGAGKGQAQARAQKPPEKAAERAPEKRASFLDIPPDAPGGHDQRIASIRASVGGQAILDEEVLAAAAQGLSRVQSEDEKNKILNEKLGELIDREVVWQDCVARLSGKGSRFLDNLKMEARKQFEKQWLQKMMYGNHFTEEEEFKRFLEKNNMPLRLIQRQWERQFIVMEYLRYRIEPHINKIGHLQIQDYYEKHPDEFKIADGVEWQDIFVAAGKHASRDGARQHAELLAARIRKGEDFVKLCKQFDNGDSSLRNNAEGIGRSRGEIKPLEAEAVLFAMQDGETRVVEIETGYHVLRLVKRQHAGVQPFNEKVQRAVRDKLRGQVFQRETKRIIADLKRRAVIEIAQKVR